MNLDALPSFGNLTGSPLWKVKPEWIDRRQWMRFGLSAQASLQLRTSPELARFEAQAVDILVSGIGLVLDRLVEVGGIWQLELTSDLRIKPLNLLVRAVQVAPQAGSPGRWAVGCRIISELRERELHGALGHSR